MIAGYVQDVTVAHNYIHHVPYTAISLGWGCGNSDISTGDYRPTPWTEPSVCMRNKIVNNHIHNAMSVLSDCFAEKIAKWAGLEPDYKHLVLNNKL